MRETISYGTLGAEARGDRAVWAVHSDLGSLGPGACVDWVMASWLDNHRGDSGTGAVSCSLHVATFTSERGPLGLEISTFGYGLKQY